MQGALVSELDPTCHNWKILCATTKMQHSQINRYFILKKENWKYIFYIIYIYMGLERIS